MIGSFRHKGLKEFFETGSKRGISADLAARIGRRLDVLEAAQELSDIDAAIGGSHSDLKREKLCILI